MGDKFHLEMKELYFQVLHRLEEIKPLIKNYKRNSLIHDDPIPANILQKKNKDLILLDWELANYDYFFLDFGCVIAESHLNKELETIFLKEYGFGIKPNERKIVEAVKLRMLLSLIGWCIERLAMSKQGKISFALQNNNKYEKLLKKEMRHIKSLLNKQ